MSAYEEGCEHVWVLRDEDSSNYYYHCSCGAHHTEPKTKTYDVIVKISTVHSITVKADSQADAENLAMYAVGCRGEGVKWNQNEITATAEVQQ